MKRKDAEYLYGSLEAYYGIAVAGSLFFGVIGFTLQIFINGGNDVFEKAAYSCFCAGGIFPSGDFRCAIGGYMRFTPVRYVHEMQQAFRLNGIDKEFNLTREDEK